MILRCMHIVHISPAAAGTLCVCPCFMQLYSSDDELRSLGRLVTHLLYTIFCGQVLSAALAFSELCLPTICVV